MTDLINDLDKLIKRAALDGALTKDAVEMFNSIVKENTGLKESIKNSEEMLESSVKARDALRQERDDARLVRDELIKREDDLKERETKITRLEIGYEFAELRRHDVMACFDTVFKNVTLRKEVMTAVPGLKADQYGSSHSPYAHKEEVSEKEE